MKVKEWKKGTLKDSINDKGPYKKVLNKLYLPNAKRPSWCIKNNKEMIPHFRCMCYGKDDKTCPYFVYCDVEEKDYKLFDKAYNKKYKGDKK